MSVHVVSDILYLLLLRVTDDGLVDLEEDITTERLNSCGCGSGNLNNLLHNLVYVADLGLGSRDEASRVGGTEVVLDTCEQVEV